MNKQQQIEEIANIPHKCIKSGCEGCIKNDRKCAYYKQAEALYDAGYRKADEVRKETAEKIFNKIKIKVLTEDMTEDRPQTLYRFTSFDIMKMAREIVEEFGVVFANGHATVEIKE